MAADVWNSLAGYVMIEVEGLGLERLVNRALREGVEIWGIRRDAPRRMRACVSVAGFYALRRLTRGQGLRVHILEKHGLTIALSRLRYRRVMAYGWLIALGALLLASRFIWFIRVEGCDRVPEGQIIQSLAQMGVKPGIRRGSITTGGLGKAIAQTDPAIAWAGAELYGVVLQVSVREAEQGPALLAEGEPASIYAAKDGVIRRITALSGKPRHVQGDAVIKGQELIGGDLGNGVLVQARGEVIARVLYRFTYTAPREQEVWARGGRSSEHVRLSLYGRELWPAELPYAQHEYELIERRGMDILLPIAVERVRAHELTQQTRALADETLAEQAEAGAEALMQAGIKHTARILSRQLALTVEETGVTATLDVIAEENIAIAGAVKTNDE